MDNSALTFASNAEDTANVRQVKAVYSSAREQALESLRKLLVPEPVWDVCPGFPEGGVYKGMIEVFGQFYPKLLSRVHSMRAVPDTFLDGGNSVVVLGHYQITSGKDDPPTSVRFAHVWGINEDGRIKGVWQVADSARFPAKTEFDGSGIA